MDLTSTSSCKTENCDLNDCNCNCDDCLEYKIADTCLCVCHIVEPKLF
jgi:hypothetical protein